MSHAPAVVLLVVLVTGALLALFVVFVFSDYRNNVDSCEARDVPVSEEGSGEMT
jgi:hypothetical protein